MKNILFAVTLTALLACGETVAPAMTAHLPDGTLITSTDGLPPGWVAWSDYTPEPNWPAGTPACGHECPGAGGTHVWKYRACGTSVTVDNNVQWQIDWECFESLNPAWKECYVTKPDLQHQASIEFETSTDETRCAYLRDFWVKYRDDNPTGVVKRVRASWSENLKKFEAREAAQ